MTKKPFLETISDNITRWVGTPLSIVVHTFLFVAIFTLSWVGVSLENILLVLTTAVSLEAIYLAIFIQMTVNKQSQSLEDVADDLEDIQEDVEDIQEDVDDMQVDVEQRHNCVRRTDHILLLTAIKELQLVRKDIESLKNKLS